MADDSGRGHFGARLRGAVYAFLHATAHKVFIGPTIKGWLLVGPLFVALFLVLTGQSIVLAIGIVIATLILRAFYWKAGRDGYVHFIPETVQQPADGTTAVADNQKVPIKASGIFSVKDWEEYVLARPAEYWRVPMGDHAIMVQQAPGRFLYQFLRRGAIEAIEAGSLWHGRQQHSALAITFLSSWGPESEDPSFMFYAPSDEGNPALKQRQMYLAFEDTLTRDSVWHKLSSDGQQA
jgi:hypothetical protein